MLGVFHEEYNTSETRVHDFNALGNKLTSDNYVHSDDVNAKIAEVAGLWDELKNLSEDKKQHIQAQFDRFDLKCEEFAFTAEKFVEFLDGQRKELDSLEGEPAPLIASITSFYEDGKKIKVHHRPHARMRHQHAVLNTLQR